MWRTLHFMAILGGAAALADVPAAAQTKPAGFTPLPIQNSLVQYLIVDGKLTALPRNAGVSTSSGSTAAGWRQEYSINTVNGQSTIIYDMQDKIDHVRIEFLNGGQRAVARRDSKDGGSTIEFVQEAGNCLLTVTKGDDRRRLQGRTLWHLLIADRALCEQHLMPLLDLLRNNWKLTDFAMKLDGELSKAAEAFAVPDEPTWTALVAQLKDASYSKRTLADRQLRAAGQAVMPFLQCLDRTQLDAEQLSHVDAIIAAASGGTAEDDPPRVARTLMGDRAIWFQLLKRDDERQRSQAARHLERLIGEPLEFNPAADAETRAAQWNKLRPRFEPADAKAVEPKPAG